MNKINDKQSTAEKEQGGGRNSTSKEFKPEPYFIREIDVEN
tara:strand:+ start:650 stop:772 length:123 start_codon:yes stop_codon:yes gene_type:complete